MVNKLEKEVLLKYFPNTRFTRTCRGKSSKHHYYMVEEKDQLRFLSGLGKTQKNYTTGNIDIIIPGFQLANVDAVKALENLLENNIMYYSGILGGMSNEGLPLDEFAVSKSEGFKNFCKHELSELRKKHKAILGR